MRARTMWLPSVSHRQSAGFRPRSKRLPYSPRPDAICVATAAGRATISSVTCKAPRGSGARGVEWADVDAKYSSLLERAGVATPTTQCSMDALHAFENASSPEALLASLRDLVRAQDMPIPEGLQERIEQAEAPEVTSCGSISQDAFDACDTTVAEGMLSSL